MCSLETPRLPNSSPKPWDRGSRAGRGPADPPSSRIRSPPGCGPRRTGRVLVDLDDADALIVEVLLSQSASTSTSLRIIGQGNRPSIILIGFLGITGQDSARRRTPPRVRAAASAHASGVQPDRPDQVLRTLASEPAGRVDIPWPHAAERHRQRAEQRQPCALAQRQRQQFAGGVGGSTIRNSTHTLATAAEQHDRAARAAGHGRAGAGQRQQRIEHRQAGQHQQDHVQVFQRLVGADGADLPTREAIEAGVHAVHVALQRCVAELRGHLIADVLDVGDPAGGEAHPVPGQEHRHRQHDRAERGHQQAVSGAIASHLDRPIGSDRGGA